ncbi:hypothetical protein LB503_004415 [Fusarium chuoi]|nr:hypothetical protein LB503_004415 [Fusarium chuoi]
MVTPLLKRRFWVMAGYATDKTGNSQTPHYNGSRLESHELRSGRANNSKVHDPYSITNVVSRSESQEEIVQKDLPSLPEQPPCRIMTESIKRIYPKLRLVPAN